MRNPRRIIKNGLAIGLLTFLFVLKVMGQEKLIAIAKPTDVTIYTNAVEVNNKVNINIPKGNVMLYVKNVANDLDLNTVQIAAPVGITVLSISSTEHIKEEEIVNATHKRLLDSIDLIIARRELLLNRQKAAQGALKILSNEQLIGSGNKIDVQDLSKLVDYYQTKSLDLNTSIASLTKSIASEDKLLARLREQVKTYVSDGSILLVQLSTTKAIQGTLDLSYLTYGAGWQAYYELRAKSISSPLEILYKARVSQSTGVDWKNVKLTLSTGNPSKRGNAPVLSPSYAYLYSPQLLANAYASKAQNKIQSVEKYDNIMLEEAIIVNSSKTSASTTVTENQMSATFEIDIPYDIISDGKPHSVSLKEYVHPVDYKYYAVPKLDKDVFLLAELNNFERLNLVAGEANIIFENMFVGTSYINPVMTTDTLNLSMGRDKAITVKRERIMDAKSTQVSSSSRKQTYTYEIRVRNAKTSAVDLVLKDQYPISTDKSIEIELLNNGGASVNSETGILTWITNIKPGETKTYRFTYTIKSPKDGSVSFN